MISIKPISRAASGVLAGLMLTACGNSDQPQLPQEVLRPVRTLVVAPSEEGTRREFPGVVDAAQKADLGFRVAGKLEEIAVKEGDQVNKGQLIARLDQTDFNIRLDSRQAGYERAKADFERAERLVGEGHISRSDYDKLKAQYSTAEAQLASAQQDLKYTELHAPFPGYIAKRYVHNFEEVSAKQNIVALQDISSLLVKIDVPETVMIRVKRGGQNRTLHAMFEAIPGEVFPLTFKEAATQADEKSQTFEATFSMPAPGEHIILPGMTVTVVAERLSGGETDTLVYLPAHTVLEDREGRYVYLAVPESRQEAVIRRRAVTTGRLTAQGMEVTAGLAAGDRIVTAGMSKLIDGKRVRLTSGAEQ